MLNGECGILNGGECVGGGVDDEGAYCGTVDECESAVGVGDSHAGCGDGVGERAVGSYDGGAEDASLHGSACDGGYSMAVNSAVAVGAEVSVVARCGHCDGLRSELYYA